MIRKVLHSKIHHAIVTETRPDYSGSLTVDLDIMRACGMRANDVVLIANCETGDRFETYLFEGNPSSGIIGVNGAAAHLANVGDKIIVLHWAHVSEKEYQSHFPTILIMNEDNTIFETSNYSPSEPDKSLANY